MSEWKKFRDEQLKNDPVLKAEYDALEPEFNIIQAMIDARKNTGLSQTQLAARTGIDQSDISRIETGDANPSLNTLKRLAAGMNMKIRLEFLPMEGQQAMRVR
jgi:ribosome-binding protein aMBF1 (putative translation factor)